MISSMTRRAQVCAAITSMVVVGGTAAFAEPAALRSGDSWQMDLTWWIFGPVSTSGTSTVADQPADIDMNLRDALEVLDFTSSLRFEAWNGDWGIMADLNYLGISEEGGTTIGGGPLARDLAVEVDAEQAWVSLMAGYRFAEGVTDGGGAFAFDVHGGGRYNRLKQDIKVSGPVRTVNAGGTEYWWEPVIGARGIWQINEDWTFAAIADAGGFGAGGNDLAWSANAAFDWSFSERTSLKFGYRYYSIDFETEKSDGTFGWDIVQHGPFIGVTIALN